MNESHEDPAGPGEDLAALWAARLDDGALETADRRALDAWLAEDPSRGAELARYRQLSANLGAQLSALLLAEPPAAVKPEIRRRRLNPGWAAVCVLGAAAGVALTVWLARPGAKGGELATPAGQRRAFTLADGTQVELNARTRLEVKNTATERHVSLAEGEVFFVVTKDRTRPFIVDTPAGSVRVTGTKFDVRTETSSELIVTVVEGNVQVSPAGGGEGGPRVPVLLGASDRLSAGSGGVSTQTLSDRDLDDVLAWRQGKIVFRGTPLRDALARFAHYHGLEITATAAAAAAVPGIGGRFSLDDLDGFFAALGQTATSVQVARGPGGSARVSLRTEAGASPAAP